MYRELDVDRIMATLERLHRRICERLPESGLGRVAEELSAVASGIAVFFLLTLEGRIKRRASLRGLHELRSIAHVVDMHQLTKDPEQFLSLPAAATTTSPARILTRFQMARYLDYCSELLSLTSKLAALHAQYLMDPVVLDAVNDVESLAGALSVKIWQKTMILDSIAVRGTSPEAVPTE